MVTVRCALSMVVVHDWLVLQMDVFKEVFMVLPQGFCSNGETSKVFRLKKSLYGPKQVSRQWNIKFTTALMKFGFQQSKNNYSLFTKRIDQIFLMILIYVDDLLITRNDIMLIKDSQNTSLQNFKIKELGELRYFLGIKFLRYSKWILMTQRKYILKLIAESSLGGTKSLEKHMKFTTTDSDMHLQK
ncbi:hypothetical protein KY290_000912 [Solanum tuberosum]|uniref:Reverse transcriptase Ty1/copia-type domain-containing protein n=1 Tax=Solanum tuberosum TaxID=4113 RepID=A0ABQ7WKN2_SOLTU|nr:hypothetical protein KY290_000912 [Solanum tuberosum]